MMLQEIKIPYLALKEIGVKNASSILLYGIILFHAYHSDRTWVSNKTLASELGCTDRQVRNCLNDLKEKKAIDIYTKVEKDREKRYIRPMVVTALRYECDSYKGVPDGNGGFTEL